jgi:spore germination cell wall hydrolase CwlJ-like protein
MAVAAMPTQAAFQDLAALLARQPGVTERAQRFVLESPFGTIHAATFSMPRPVGTAIPHPPVYALANFDPLDVATSIGAQFLGDARGPLQFPSVNRRDKRDSHLARRRMPLPPLPPLLAIEPVTQADVEAALRKDDDAGNRFDPYTQYEFASLPDAPQNAEAGAKPAKPVPRPDPKLAKEDARIYFGAAPLVARHEQLKPYQPGEAPIVRLAKTGTGDPDIKLAALTSGSKADDDKGGETIANKGEVTGAEQRPQSPAERLGLTGKSRDKAEKCLANAVYFEARGEPVRGQIAVAQVVMNRVFSPFYPKTVCGVVYQNSHRHLSCQFTFACDGIPDVVTEPDPWARAQRIARDVLDGKLWMPEVAKSTHYHASWVHPDWVNEMRKIYRLGVHTFYRPRNWGDGADEPSWQRVTAEEIKKIN